MPDPQRKPSWKAIAAMARNRVIGHEGGIPWHLPEDFKWVKQCTQGHTIVMGRRTFESIGRPLPNRMNIVVSRSAHGITGCTVIRSLDELDQIATQGEVWIFGGAEIYESALPRIDEIFLTIVKSEPPGDTFFPPFEDQFELAEVLRDEPEFQIRRYLRR